MRRCVAAYCAGTLPLALVSALLGCAAVHAQEPARNAELQRQLQQRDAVLADLLRRVEDLERRLDARASAPPPQQAAVPQREPVRLPPEASIAPTPRPPAETGAAPGRFAVDEEAAERALERTLVQAGALLLAPGQFEITPGFTYTRRELDAPIFLTEAGITTVATQRIRRNEFASDLGLRFGLPLDAQFELALPYRYVDQSTTIEAGFAMQDEENSHGKGVGDISIGFAKTLLREGEWLPDLIGRLDWNTPTGETTDNGVSLGSGANAVEGRLTALKRQDPLAFVVDLSYLKAFERNDQQPGDRVGLSVGTVLAASPETALSLAFNQQFVDEVEFAGQRVQGSDLVIGTFDVGASLILGARTLLNVVGSVGLTDDAPDYAVRVSLPIRFDRRF